MNINKKIEIKNKVLKDFNNYFNSLNNYRNNKIIGEVLNNNLDIIKKDLILIKKYDLREFFRSEIIKMNFDNIEDYFNN